MICDCVLLVQGNEKRVYEFVVRHFLACCSKDAQGEETTVEIEVNLEKVCTVTQMIVYFKIK